MNPRKSIGIEINKLFKNNPAYGGILIGLQKDKTNHKKLNVADIHPCPVDIDLPSYQSSLVCFNLCHVLFFNSLFLCFDSDSLVRLMNL